MTGGVFTPGSGSSAASCNALLLQLAFHVRKHAAGKVAIENLRFHAGDVRKELLVARVARRRSIFEFDEAWLVEPLLSRGPMVSP